MLPLFPKDRALGCPLVPWNTVKEESSAARTALKATFGSALGVSAHGNFCRKNSGESSSPRIVGSDSDVGSYWAM